MGDWLGQRDDGKRVLLVLGEAFEDAEVVAVLDGCGWLQYRPHLPSVQVTTAGFRDEVHGRFGMVVVPDAKVVDVAGADYDAIVVPGGFQSRGWSEVHDDSLYRVVREAYAAGALVVTMCVGVIPVAEAGLLQGGRATTYEYSANHDNFARLKELGAEPVYQPVVEWNRIVSNSGPLYADRTVELLLERLFGKEVADEVHHYRAGVTPRD